MILNYKKTEHTNAILYASINVLYLKLIQYEKYKLPVDFVNIHNMIDKKLETLIKKGYNNFFNNLSTIYKYSLINVHMNKNYSHLKLMDDFLFDITCLSIIDKELSNEIIQELQYKNLVSVV